MLRKLIWDEEGATATEYAVMLVLIIVVALATIIFLGQKVENGFNRVASAPEQCGELIQVVWRNHETAAVATDLCKNLPRLLA